MCACVRVHVCVHSPLATNPQTPPKPRTPNPSSCPRVFDRFASPEAPLPLSEDGAAGLAEDASARPAASGDAAGGTTGRGRALGACLGLLAPYPELRARAEQWLKVGRRRGRHAL
jgi:hypothetical protein